MGLLSMISHLGRKSFADESADDRVGKIDTGALSILRALEEAGFEAYVVGGCVRDLLMGLVPHDWDITTSAHPGDTVRVAAAHGWKAVDGGGRRFGTVIIVLNGQNYEVTTFRSESYGEDAHRPSEVSFSKTLKEDLARRDFTVNAMAVDADGTIYDYFHGEEDLEKKRLRTVGEAGERFHEDALRLFRACRFLGQLDFMADTSLVDGIASAFPRVAGLSLERVKSEVDKLIVTPHAARGFDLMVRTGLADCSCRVKEAGNYEEIPILPELHHLVDLPQEKQFHKYDGWYHTLAVLEAAQPLLVNRWGALLHDVGKGMPGVRGTHKGRITDYGHDKKGAEMAEDILTRWRRPEAFTRRVVWIVENHMRFHFFANDPSADAEKWVRQMARDKEFPSSKDMAEAIGQLTDVDNADIIGCGRPLSATEGHTAFGKYMQDLALAMPVTTRELHYDPRVPEALGSYARDGFQNLLLRVQNGALENEPGALYEAAVRYRERHEKNEGKE